MDLTGISSIADLIKDGIDRIWPNKSDPAYIQAQAALVTAQTAGAFKQMDNDFQISLAQIQTNAAAAAKQGLTFRDGAGWTCVFSFVVMTIKPLVEWGTILSGHPVTLPAVDPTVAMTMLGALLGVGGMHTYQTVKTQ